MEFLADTYIYYTQRHQTIEGEMPHQVPEIEVNNASTHDLSVQASVSPQNNLLSPYPRSSSTPTAIESGDERSSIDRSSLNIPPPSPTLSIRSSIQSVHFATSTDLRNNDPQYGHSRRPSFASGASSTTVPDENTDASPREHSELGHETIRVESHSPSISSNPKRGKKKRGGISEADERTAYQRELDQDKNFDPAPFAFKPFQLAHLVNPPRDLEAMGHLGGTQVLLRGLGTDGERGLSKEALGVNSGALVYQAAKEKEERDRVKAEKKNRKGWRWGKGAGQGASPRHETEEDEDEEEMKMRKDEHIANILEPSPDVLDASVDERRRVYGPNLLPKRPSKSLLFLMWLALKDKVLVLLSIAAVISLALGLFQDFGTPRKPGDAPVDWVEGVAIMVAIAIVVIVGSLNDWQKERQFKQLNDKKEERGVKVIRDGVECFIDSKEVVVGDIALLEPGEVVPCDGVFISGQHVRCDEAGATGESDAMRKLSYEECMEFIERDGRLPAHSDCFIVSGSKVLEGVGRYVVIAVGTKSFHGRIMIALQSDPETTPLQLKLNALAELIAKIGSIAGLILFVALMIRFFVQLGQNNPVRTANEKGIAFVNILIISVTLIVVAVPEGLPLAVTLALAFATKRMTYENLLVRILGSCEIMANASVVCTDKTGTLTQNLMTVVAGSIGVHAKFVRNLDENSTRHNADGKDESPGERKNRDDFSIDQARLIEVLPPALSELFNEAIAVNSTAFEDKDLKTGQLVFVGSKTETALLQFAKELGWKSFKETRGAAKVVQMIPFSSQRKAMCVVVELPGKVGYRAYLKGASELLSKCCTKHVVVHPPSEKGPEKREDIEVKAIEEPEADNINRTIIFYANQTLRTIALCYRDFDQWPPKGIEHNEENEVEFSDLAQDLTLIGITGIEDPLRSGVREAVAKCRKAGVTVKMCTGDNVLTARSIALQCGIFTPAGIIMEGPHFRRLTKADRIEIVPRLQVLARSSPEDKEVLVSTLKSLGEIVGVTGDGTNDGPALKEANVGFSMGIAGTEVAKEASDIILMDDNFASIVKAIMWGRCVNDAVRKFLQFQLSTNVTAVIITFVSAVASDQEASVLTAVQLLWINIIMDTFAALALATDPASESLLDRQPDKKTTPLFTTNMYKQIFIQSIYQIAIILVFHFLGLQILGLELTGNAPEDKRTKLTVQTLVFNAFVFAQIFNSLNCRRLDKKLNVFEGMLKNRYFLGITLIEIGVQILIVFVGGDAFQVTKLKGREWGISLALGIVSVPLGALIRLLPNEPFERLFKKLGFLGRPEALPTVSTEGEAWSNTVNIVRQNLGTFTNIRGGRTRSSSIVTRGKMVLKRSDSDVKLPKLTSSHIMAMVPSLVAGAVASQRTTRGSLSDPAAHDPSRSSAALMEGHLQFHPDTPPDDPLFKRYGSGNHQAD
ncbi:hypothetical protein C0993_003978 [Termitomyces sp. T159_Od127]|nr:hypothetical protein C0993_003978 [Termitomyces sp. T159_Od127]